MPSWTFSRARRGSGLRFVGCALAALAIAAGMTACGSSTQSVTAPSSVKCGVNASAKPSSFAPRGGSGTLAIATNRECQWSATPSGDWIQLGAAGSGQGNANVPFSVAANADPAERHGTIAVGDQQVTITQAGAPCAFSVSPASVSIGPAAQRGTIAVTATSAQCAWTARSGADWLAIVAGAEGTGNGRVTYEARASDGPTRTGRLTVAGESVLITQGEGCSTSISPEAQNVGAAGGTGTITVTTGAGCPWSAQSDVPWITIDAGASGNGGGVVTFNVTENPPGSPERTGSITVGGQTFTVTQASAPAPCSYSLDPASLDVPASGSGTDSYAFSVDATAGCAWTATATDAWIHIVSGSGAGPGSVRFTVDANPDPDPRTGTIDVAGQSLSVRQAGP